MELNKKFDVSTLPISFYVHTLEFVNHSSWDPRYTIRFEAVKKENIEMFLSGVLPEKLPKSVEKSLYFEKLWEIFKNKGTSDQKFRSNKCIYLAECGNAEINVMMVDYSSAKKIELAENDWWELTICAVEKGNLDEKNTCDLAMHGYAEIEEEFSFELRPVSDKEEQSLYELYEPYIDEEQQAKAMEQRVRDGVEAVGPTTIFNELVIFYVGAALCCCILDGANNPTAYFDMGAESSYANKQLKKANPANYPTMCAATQSSYNSVLNDVANFPNLDVIVSHWHTDHVSILNDLALDYVNSGGVTNANFWTNMSLIAPACIRSKGWAVTYNNNVHAALTLASRVALLVAPCVNVNRSIQLALGWTNLEVWKCDRNDTRVTSSNAHDHGIFAKLVLASGKNAFLAGDCAYDTLSVGNPTSTVLNNNGAGYDALVVSHHGGKYTHTTAHNKTQYIPIPTAGADACYSANGVAYRHPNTANVTAYTTAGWTANYCHDVPLTAGNFFLFIQ